MTDEMYPIYPLKFVSGDTVRRTVQVVDPDPASLDPDNPTMIPRNLAGWTAKAQIRKTTKKDAPLIATIELSGFGADGKIEMYLAPSESNKIVRECGWDFELTDPSGDVNTILGGPVIPEGDYSR